MAKEEVSPSGSVSDEDPMGGDVTPPSLRRLGAEARAGSGFGALPEKAMHASDANPSSAATGMTSSTPPAELGPDGAARNGMAPPAKLKSILVQPERKLHWKHGVIDEEVEMQSELQSPNWQAAKTKHRGRPSALPLREATSMKRRGSGRPLGDSGGL